MSLPVDLTDKRQAINDRSGGTKSSATGNIIAHARSIYSGAVIARGQELHQVRDCCMQARTRSATNVEAATQISSRWGNFSYTTCRSARPPHAVPSLLTLLDRLLIAPECCVRSSSCKQLSCSRPKRWTSRSPRAHSCVPNRFQRRRVAMHFDVSIATARGAAFEFAAFVQKISCHE